MKLPAPVKKNGTARSGSLSPFLLRRFGPSRHLVSQKGVASMTLQELFDQVKVAGKVRRVPSVVMLAQSGVQVVAQEFLEGEVSITAYENGYAVYQSGRFVTVFSIHECREYVYQDTEGKPLVIPFSVFADQPWQIRLLMEGHDRLTRNREKEIQQRTLSYDVFETESTAMHDGYAGDALRILVERETEKERLEWLRQGMQTLSEKERYTVWQCIGCKRTKTAVAQDLGVVRQTLDWYYKKAMKKLKKEFPDDRDF